MARDPQINEAYAGRMFATWYTPLAVLVILGGQISATLLFDDPSTVRLAVLGWTAFSIVVALTALYVRYSLLLARRRAETIVPELETGAAAAAEAPADPGAMNRLMHASETFVNSPFLVRVAELPPEELEVLRRWASPRPAGARVTVDEISAFHHLAFQLVHNSPSARQIPRMFFSSLG